MVWIAGRSRTPVKIGEINTWAWELLGVYSHEEAAVARCAQDMDFVAPAVVDVDQPEDTTLWPGMYYPKTETRPSAEIEELQ